MAEDSLPPTSLRAMQSVAAELRRELDHALRQLASHEEAFASVQAQADELERATLHALLKDKELEQMRSLLGRLKKRIVVLHDRSAGTSFETELLDLRTILEIHGPADDDE